MCERVVNPQGDVYLTLSCTVDGVSVGAGERRKRTAVLLGIEDKVSRSILAASQDDRSGKTRAASASEDVLNRTIAHARQLPSPAESGSGINWAILPFM